MSSTREREEDGLAEPAAKRTRLELEEDEIQPKLDSTDTNNEAVNSAQPSLNVLPPSHALLSAPRHSGSTEGPDLRILETDVGISEYVGHDIPKIEGIIKQRFTDFLVYEVDLDSNVIHVKSLLIPESSKKKVSDNTESAKSVSAAEEITVPVPPDVMPSTEANNGVANNQSQVPVAGTAENRTIDTAQDAAPAVDTKESEDSAEPWPTHFTSTLSQFLSEGMIQSLKDLYLEGPEPPFVSDAGWGSRDTTKDMAVDEEPTPKPVAETSSRGRGGRGRARGGRGGRGGGGRPAQRPDNRKVISNPIDDKNTRTALHKAVRELFGGKLESETDTTEANTGDGARVVIKWIRDGTSGRGGRGDRGGGRGGKKERPPRGTYPPYIHFTLQKTNRDTQDALSYLSRTLHVNVKDLSVAGTKDKRGVTVQRVSLWRGSKTVEDIWRLAHGNNGRRTDEDGATQRGERGIRIADFNYRKARLELGMLKGNAFVITLRNVQVDSLETLNRAMQTVKDKGFINYYGMQRFGTASIPTHSVGLALLKAEWQKAVTMILSKRPGEHPDVEAARDAWLVEGNLTKALALLPRRVVAERCILESYLKQNGETRNAFGVLSTIPRNLRLMYVHAYQSYLWNAIVSERIRMYGAEKPAVGDLVYASAQEPEASATEVAEEQPEEHEQVAEDVPEKPSAGRKEKKPWKAPEVKTLSTEDLDKYSIFDVIMPLPGRDVDYPGGALGERYQQLVKADGLDPTNWSRPQKDYSLGGSYRHIMHLPKAFSWSVMRYTDPDVPLAQADEDQLLGFDPPQVVEDGKFMAVQVRLQLGTATYATMALRELTKTETSSHFQTELTKASEDQKYRGAPSADAVEETTPMEE